MTWSRGVVIVISWSEQSGQAKPVIVARLCGLSCEALLFPPVLISDVTHQYCLSWGSRAQNRDRYNMEADCRAFLCFKLPFEHLQAWVKSPGYKQKQFLGIWYVYMLWRNCHNQVITLYSYLLCMQSTLQLSSTQYITVKWGCLL
jgi:hypothetical protein